MLQNVVHDRSPVEAGLLGQEARRTNVHGAFAEEALQLLLDALERRPDLAQRLQRAFGLRELGVERNEGASRYMSIREYAVYSRVSERTVRTLIRQGMTEGTHFHRDGRTGRRVVVHVEAADAWRESRTFAKANARPLHELATNEILRRRAKTALEKAGVRG